MFKLLKILGLIEPVQYALRYRKNLGYLIYIIIQDNPDITVSEIIEKTGKVQSLVSDVLGKLREADLISKNKRGKFVHYTITDNIKNIETYIK